MIFIYRLKHYNYKLILGLSYIISNKNILRKTWLFIMSIYIINIKKPKKQNPMKKINEIQRKKRLELIEKGWKFYKNSTHAVCPNQLRLTVNDAYMYAYPSMQEVWCDLCIAFGLKENHDLHPKTTNYTLPDGPVLWRVIAINKERDFKLYEHKLSSCRIDYSE